ncbi:helix-turn-helix domain-containing protein [Puia sp. P3]|uniref:helix-turn-helix domain-containing protein n=1 Tax=Puia sp. P3 TaxID=3423952 RepID=UPI003D677B86
MNKLNENKRKISTNELYGESYLSGQPYASHFHFLPDLENFIRTLELNYFISKYGEMSDKDGVQVSIYCINYGLATKSNLLWGKAKGKKYRKYFIARPFNFSALIKEFLAVTKVIHCSNIECNQKFTQDQIKFLEFANFRCNKCSSPVVIESISTEIQNQLKQIETKDLLAPEDIDIIMELASRENAMVAREIAEELDMSSQSIGQKNKMLDLKKGLVKRNKKGKRQSHIHTN